MHRNRPVVAVCGVALAAALVLAGCGSKDGDSSSDTSSATTAQAAQGGGIGSNTALAEKLLAPGQAPDGGQPSSIENDSISRYVLGRQAIQKTAEIFGGECDKALKADAVADHLLSDGVINKVTYTEPDNKTANVMVALAPGRLGDFLDQQAYNCESNEIPQSQIPGAQQGSTPANVQLKMRTEDAPHVDGAEGFREYRDIITTSPEGGYHLERNVIVHGFAADTTVDVSFTATSNEPDSDPVTPEALARVDAVYTAEMNKLLGR